MEKLFRVYILTLLIIGCNSPISLEYYPQWRSDNLEHIVTVEKNNYRFECEYIPIEMMIFKEYGAQLNEIEYDSLKNEYIGLRYFQFKFGGSHSNVMNTPVTNSHDYFSKLEYFTSKAQNSFYIRNGELNEKCQMYHFERYYNSVPYDIAILGFDNVDLMNDSTSVIFMDQVLGVGEIEFVFNTDQLNKVPQLVF